MNRFLEILAAALQLVTHDILDDRRFAEFQIVSLIEFRWLNREAFVVIAAVLNCER